MSTATRKIGSCPPHVHRFLSERFPRGAYMARDHHSQLAPVGVSMQRLAVETLRVLANDDGLPQQIRDDAVAELRNRSEDIDLEPAHVAPFDLAMTAEEHQDLWRKINAAKSDAERNRIAKQIIKLQGEMKRAGAKPASVQAARPKRKASGLAPGVDPQHHGHHDKELALALSQAKEFDFVKFCEREAKRLA